MKNSEFENRVFANPDDTSEDFLQALSEDPQRQQLLAEVKAFNSSLIATLNGVEVPTGLATRLKSNAESKEATSSADVGKVAPLARPWYRSSGFALAASLVLGIGIVYSALFSNNGPTAEERAFGQQVLDHVYMELDEYDSSNNLSIQILTEVVASVGGQMRLDDPLAGRRVLFAKPCVVIPQSNSAHFVLQGNQGSVNIVVVRNTPVNQEFTLEDDRFDSVVIPLNDGNLILVGEKTEILSNYRELLASNVDWI